MRDSETERQRDKKTRYVGRLFNRERERERERKRQTDRQADRQTERQIERNEGDERETDSDKDKE